MGWNMLREKISNENIWNELELALRIIWNGFRHVQWRLSQEFQEIGS